MSFTGVLGLVVLGIVAVALLGPAKLPAGVEQIWLMLTNFRRSQNELPPLTLEQARRSWQMTDNPLYDLVQILYASVEHLVELRRRIFIVIGVMAVAGILASFFTNQIMLVLTRPRGDVQLIFTAPTDMLFTYIEIILSVAAVIGLPVLIYQTLMFIRPGLEGEQEIKTFNGVVWFGVPMVAVFFVLGLSFAYFVMLPFALQYLASFGGGLAKPTWTIRAYYSFVLSVMLWIGVAFETPLVMAVLARLGVVSPQSMVKQWRYAILGIAVVSAIITPTIDPVNMALVMAPLLLLYFLGVGMARLVYHPRTSSLASESSPEAGS